MLRRALCGRLQRQLCQAALGVAPRRGGCGGAAFVGASCLRRGLHASAAVYGGASDATGTGAAIRDRSRVRQADLAEALADLDELVGGGSNLKDGAGSGLLERSGGKSAFDEHSGAEELTDLLAMVKQRDQPEEVGSGTGEEWGSGGPADLSDTSRDALSTSVRSRARAELTEALRQEEIEDARARYNKKRWARNWVVKRTAELHRRKADAAEVEQAIQHMITRGDMPTVVTYNTLIAACGRGGSGKAVRPSDAKRAYNAFVELKRRGLIPTASTFSALLSTLSRVDSASKRASTRRQSAAAARIEASASNTSFEKVWTEMAHYLSDHARGLVEICERDRTALCNSALTAALCLIARADHNESGKHKFAQMREYMRAHGVVHDAISFTLLVRVAKQELDDTVKETELVASRSRQRQRQPYKSRAEAAAATAAAAAAERRAALALRNFLGLWMALGAADARCQAAGKPSMLDSRLVNALLAALASAGKLVDVDPLALTATISDDEGKDEEPHTTVDDNSPDFELGYDIDDSNSSASHFENDCTDGESFYPFDDQSRGGEDDLEDDEYEDDDSESAGTRWVPHPDFGEERRARQRKAIVAMSWQLWGSFQTQVEIRAAERATRSSSHNGRGSQTSRHRNRNRRRVAQEEQQEREDVAHVLSTLTGVLLRAGDADDQGAALQTVMQYPYVRRDPVFWAVMMEASAAQADAVQCEMLLTSFERSLRAHAEDEGEAEGTGRMADAVVGTRHFNALLRAYARDVRLADSDIKSVDERVWMQLRRMQHEYGLVPDEYTISSVLTACEREQNPDRAVEVLQLALLLATGDEGDKKHTPQAWATASAPHLKPSMPLLRHAHTIFNQRWGWRRRPEALEIIWQLWALGGTGVGGEPTIGGNEFPWWNDGSSVAGVLRGADSDRPLGAGQSVGPRVAVLRAKGKGAATETRARADSYKRVDDGSVTDVDEVAVDKLLRKRQLARSRRDYEVADKLLKRLFDVHGVIVSDDDRVWAAAAAVVKDRPDKSGAPIASPVGNRAKRAIERLNAAKLRAL